MINFFQYTAKYLSNATLVRINHIIDDPYVRILIKRRLGFTPLKLIGFINSHEYILSFKGQIIIHIEGTQMNVYTQDKNESVSFKIVVGMDKQIYLIAHRVQFASIHAYKQMMSCLKTLFEEFYTDCCEICHSEYLKVTITTSQNCTLTLPSYVDISMVDNVGKNTTTSCFLKCQN
jgi:hypothetical protein